MAAFDLQNSAPEKVYPISYESLLQNKDEVMGNLGKFIISQKLQDSRPKPIRKSSRVLVQTEAERRSNSSRLWQNLNIADDTFIKNQLSKWKNNNELSNIDISHIEASCFHEMKSLGYQPASNERPTVSQIDVEKFEAENVIGNKEKQERLRTEDKEDWERRQNQEKILKDIFRNELEIVIDDKADQDGKSTSKSGLQ